MLSARTWGARLAGCKTKLPRCRVGSSPVMSFQSFLREDDEDNHGVLALNIRFEKE
ncbi:hypothetical protein UVI_02007980 [Ustilaginoidea virens]|uniref:Uncharacterized protein n=1 Tax=Ustilaginoidea virens TaxID=1159556 RepID=A0A1B5L6L0_USTVR|nr:hypothetical protein UVI_02007980 [Ustilaginoidea virens]